MTASPAARSAEAASEAGVRSIIALHPYFGFTVRPGMTPVEALQPDQVQAMSGLTPEAWTSPQAPAWMHVPANALGMWSERPFPYVPTGDEVVIGVFGGSLASWLATQGPEALRAHLRRGPLGDSRVVVLNFAIHGGKQPQQLAVLNYVLSHGQHLDIAINIDGVNELLWASYNRDVHAIDFSFPTAHLLGPMKHLMAGGEAGAEGLLALADSVRARLRADRFARWQRRIPTAMLRAACAALERRLRTRSTRLLMRAAEAVADPATDPLPFPPASDVADDAALGAYWQRCSRQFHRVCRAHGVVYLHVLQPSPYATPREPSADERAFLQPDGASAHLLRREYPRLIAFGTALQQEGIAFTVADHAFAPVGDTVFSDHWGHLSRRGNDILAECIAHRLAGVVPERVRRASA